MVKLSDALWNKNRHIRLQILVAEIKRKIEEFGDKEKNKEKTHCDKLPAEKSIDFRPKEANKRSEFGHWEGDLVVGKDGKGAALLTFTERKTREEIIFKIPSKHAVNVAKSFVKTYVWF